MSLLLALQARVAGDALGTSDSAGAVGQSARAGSDFMWTSDDPLVLDAFTDALAPRGLTQYSAAWTNGVMASDLAPQTTGTAVTSPSSGSAGAAVNRVSVADSEAFATVATKPTTNDNWLALVARVQNPAASLGCYMLVVWTRSGTDQVELYKVVAGGLTSLGVVQTAEYSAGDRFKLRVVGTTITAFKNGSQIGQVTDSSVSGAGTVGFRVADNVAAWDDFGGGAIHPSATRAVSLPRTAPDSLGTTDAAARTRSLPRIGSDYATLVNLVSDPSFEYADLSQWAAVSGATLAQSASHATSRTNSLRVQGTLSGQGASTTVVSRPGQILTATANVFVATAGAGTQATLSFGGQTQSTTLGATGAFSLSVTATAATANPTLSLSAGGSGGAFDFFFDSVMAVPSPIAVPYFDGATNGSWSFTADHSPSYVSDVATRVSANARPARDYLQPDYRTLVLAEPSLASYIRLGDASGSPTVADSVGSVTGTVSAVTLGAPGLVGGDANTAAQAAAGTIDFGDNYDFAANAPFTVELILKPAALGQRVVGKADGSGGWSVDLDAGGHVVAARRG